MAGSEQSGPEAADGRLFQAATWVLTPTGTTADRALHDLSGFVRRLGARVVVLSPARHDELVAIVSHLPQLAASALADVAADAVASSGEAVLAVAGGGFRDTTRIAASEPDLWLGILRGNRAAVLEALDEYLGRVTDVRDALAAGDWPGVHTVLARASAARRRLVPKAVAEPLVDLVVPLTDRPGAIAAATTALGEAGVNVEDVTMRHAVEGEGRGSLVMRVAAAAADRGLTALAAGDIPAHVERDVERDVVTDVERDVDATGTADTGGTPGGAGAPTDVDPPQGR